MNGHYKASASMDERRVQLQPAYVLHSRKYQESGSIVELFTRDHGRLAAVAKGARKAASKLAPLLQPFFPLRVSYVGTGDLKTLVCAEALGRPYPLHGMALYCGFYANELLQHFLYRHDPHPEVFCAYQCCLADLAGASPLELGLRTFELHLLHNVGYAPQLANDCQNGAAVIAGREYHFSPEYGAYEQPGGAFQGKTLLAVHHQQLDGADLAEAKRLLRLIIDHHLDGKPLKSRAFAAKLGDGKAFCTRY